jgi:RNA polymerase sigma-70 factor (ECF subfamily)
MDSSSAFLREMTALLPTLRAFGRSLCANATLADDLVQETMLKAWNCRDRFQPGSNMKAWLLTILRNRYYSELRHRKFEVEDPDDMYASMLSVQPEFEAQSELEALGRALKELPTEQREALLLVSAGGLSYREAAELCKCAVGTIKSRIARGRDQLVALLDLEDRSAPLALAAAGANSSRRGMKRMGAY